MINSYLLFIFFNQSVFGYQCPYLLNLIGFGLSSFWLQIQDFVDSFFEEYVMASIDSQRKSKFH